MGGPSVALTGDGSCIWVVSNNKSGPYLTKIRAADGAVLLVPLSADQSIIGIAFDGANIWVATVGDGTITKF